ncbi:hypothetical protein [Paracoccus sulfuroxidans]|uniref:hypothetical protein n=1 Tax=Paracoccus sulfuroxidans TaxID=384678 RepID=UPI0011A9C553|nr:hypothetical protein [Paracoccus sulfuroxidans]
MAKPEARWSAEAQVAAGFEGNACSQARTSVERSWKQTLNHYERQAHTIAPHPNSGQNLRLIKLKLIGAAFSRLKNIGKSELQLTRSGRMRGFMRER